MEKMKVKQNKNLLYIPMALLAILVILVILSIRLQGENSECKINEDCVLQQTTCCSCNMGGDEECMTKQKAEETQARLDKECSVDIMCVAMYNCNVNKCECENGNCTGIFSNETEISNPASTYCVEQGGILEIRENKLGQYGVCVKDGKECEEWAYYRGECLL
jgi:putative hemolysin